MQNNEFYMQKTIGNKYKWQIYRINELLTWSLPKTIFGERGGVLLFGKGILLRKDYHVNILLTLFSFSISLRLEEYTAASEQAYTGSLIGFLCSKNEEMYNFPRHIVAEKSER